jgi:hypothetical protein
VVLVLLLAVAVVARRGAERGRLFNDDDDDDDDDDDGGGWPRLPAHIMQTIYDRGDPHKPHYLTPHDSDEDEVGAGGGASARSSSSSSSSSASAAEETFAIPANLNRCLKPYQREGVEFMWKHFRQSNGAILGDDMGLGKTVQCIAFISALLGKKATMKDKQVLRARRRRRGGQGGQGGVDGCGGGGGGGQQQGQGQGDGGQPASRGVVMIVSPKSVVNNWRDELERWGCFEVLVANKAEQHEGVLAAARNGEVEVVLVSYPQLTRMMADGGAEVKRVRWMLAIFDEVHELKNHKTKTHKACAAVPTRRKLGLTGTIMQNDLMDLWAICSLVRPHCFGTDKEFKEEYERPIKRSRSSEAGPDGIAAGKRKKARMNAILSTMYLRRTKDETIASDMKGKAELVVLCHLTALQRRAYCRVLAAPDMELCMRSKEPCDCGRAADENGKRPTRGKCCYSTLRPEDAARALIWPRLHPGGVACPRCPSCCGLPGTALLTKIAQHPELVKCDPHGDGGARAAETARCAALIFGEDLEAVGGVARNYGFEQLSRPDLAGKIHALLQVRPLLATDD